MLWYDKAMQLLLHPQSQDRFDAIIADPPQSILLVAPEGSGKETLLLQLADSILGEHPTGRLFLIEPPEDKNSIGIDAIRELKMALRLKSDKHRVVVAPHAELLTDDAQNSFLKLLEEPPKDVHFFLAVTKLGDVLETIQSRTAVWRLTPPTTEQLDTYFSDAPMALKAKAFAIGQGRVGLITAMLKHQDDHELLHTIDVAKEILAETHFKRLVRVDALAKDQKQVVLLIESLQLICKAALEHAAKNNNHSVSQWHKRLSRVAQAEAELADNVQPKLVLDHLFMTI